MNAARRRPALSVALAICAGCAVTSGGFAQWVEEATLAGPVEEANVGGSVAVDGPTAVIGARLDDERGADAGAAYVYRFDGSDWMPEQKLLSDGGAARNEFGAAVAVSGDTIVVGAPRTRAGVTGAAYVFRYDDHAQTWHQEARLDGRPLACVDGFGSAVAIDGDYVLVGAPLYDDDLVSDVGAVYFFRRDNGIWTEVDFHPGDRAGAERGFAVTMSEQIAVDTAPGHGGGEATLWRRDGADWRPSVLLVPGLAPDHRRFGISVDTDGDRIIIGSDRQPSGPGSVFVFAHDGSRWFEEGQLLSPGGAQDEVFGCSVAIEGEAAFVGAAPSSDASMSDGSAHVYRLFSGLSWEHEWTMRNLSAGAGDGFGASLAVCETAVLIGCPRLDGVGGANAGAAFAYRCAYVLGAEVIDNAGVAVTAIGDVDFDGFEDFVVGAPRSGRYGRDAGCVDVYSGRTRELLYHRFGQRGERLGWAVASVGDVDRDGAGDFAVGSPGWDHRRGRVTVYSGRLGRVLHRVKGEHAGDRFGMAVAGGLDFDADDHMDLLVGAPYNDEAGKRAGKVYLFRARNGRLLGEITGEHAGDQFGFALAGLGEVNRDRFDDFAVGAPKSDAGGTNAGRVYVYSGKTLEPRYVVDGERRGDRFGWSLAAVGLMTGDHRADLLVGAPFSDRHGRRSTGRVTLHSGRYGDLLWGRNGPFSGDRLGWAVAVIPDIDGDGNADVLASAPRCDVAGRNAGWVFGFSGIDGSVLRMFAGEAPADRCGYAVAGIDDLDGDGFGEALIAAPFNDASRRRAGKVHVMVSSLPPLGASPLSGEEGWSPAGPAPLTWEGADEDLLALVRLLDEWGADDAGESDQDGDGFVDESDLRALLSEWDR